jgi:hypothetical protein
MTQAAASHRCRSRCADAAAAPRLQLPALSALPRQAFVQLAKPAFETVPFSSR